MTRQFYLEMLRFHSWYSEPKYGTPGFKKNFSFSENLCIENQVLKTFKITNGCHVKTCRSLNPIQDGLLWGCSQMGGGAKRPPSLKYVTYHTVMKLGTVIPHLKMTQKTNESRDTHLDFC